MNPVFQAEGFLLTIEEILELILVDFYFVRLFVEGQNPGRVEECAAQNAYQKSLEKLFFAALETQSSVVFFEFARKVYFLERRSSQLVRRNDGKLDPFIQISRGDEEFELVDSLAFEI